MSTAAGAAPRAALAPQAYLIGCAAPAPAAEGKLATMGFKAWNLLAMARMGLPVPCAFVLGTGYCADAQARATAATPAVWRAPLAALESQSGLAFGHAGRPLLLSVRSGAPVSMPGMMDTVLNVGLCDATVEGLLRRTGNPRQVWDTYRRLVAAYGETVAGLPRADFDAAHADCAAGREDSDLDFADLRELTRRYLAVYARAAGRPFPQDANAQLAGAIEAVFASWDAPKARRYRELNGIDDRIGTAVTVQCMVFGNAGASSGSGVGFTRDPTSGEPQLCVDFLFNAQGEDVVSGRRAAHDHERLTRILPETWHQLRDAAARLERAFADMQEFEFTVQEGQLFLLQTRAGKRTREAAARIALDMADAGLIDVATARARTAGIDREALTRLRIVSGEGGAQPLAHALSAGVGVASGAIALDAGGAAACRAAGTPYVLVRSDAETDDLDALEASVGMLTRHGARTSHAAVVARQLGKVCLVGCEDLRIDAVRRSVRLGAATLAEGELLTLDGNSGACYAGRLRTQAEFPVELLMRLESLRRAA